MDQIKEITASPTIAFITYKDSLATIFEHTVGVSNHFDAEPMYTKAKILEPGIIPYLQNKPFHGSQKINIQDGSVEWYVIHNIEFKRKLLAFIPN